MFGRLKENAWYYKAQKAYRKEKLPAPYAALFDYFTLMDKNRFSGGRGHFDFFSMAKFDGWLEDRVKDLRSILPEGLLENFNAAYDKYVSLGDEPEYDDIIGAFNEFDEYVYGRYEQLRSILKDYITEMIEKHYL
ncbi:MAG: hypothetical protein HFK10_05460 [Clostridia bacterium]|jgi:hypothetical protein|nr:hypothetical protein [Clostridia bacterium]